VTVKILEKEYQVSCPVNERTDLLDAAELLNGQMREIRDSGKVVGLDRIAVMAALNMANEVLKFKAREDAVQSTFGNRIRALTESADKALGDARQLDL
ncbi:MAG: cell division protein ZapA, partial [Pseudomonadota bacterium]